MKEKQTGGSLGLYMKWPFLVGISLLILSIAVSLVDLHAGLVAWGMTVILMIGLAAVMLYYRKRIAGDLVVFGAGYAQVQKQLLQEMVFPYAVTDETGRLIWMNDEFSKMVNLGNQSHKNLTALFPDIQDQFPEGNSISRIHATYNARDYEVIIRGVTMNEVMESVFLADSSLNSARMYAIYLNDETDTIRYRQEVEDEKLVTALIYLDNYEEVLDSIEEVRRSLLGALIERQISKYIATYEGVIRKMEKDKYFAIVKYQHLREMWENHFSLLDDVKKVNIGNSQSVTLSIGLGVNGASYAKNYEYARTAIDMALGRGGDQVVYKDGENITYFGGKSQSQGKNTRVKARVKAHALRELMESSDHVLIMGHKIGDADCIGSAIGIYRAARTSNKTANIVMDTISNSIEPLMTRIRESGEYEEPLFVTGAEACARINEHTLLVVVDTNRANYVECQQLLEKAQHIVVLDHHRQMKDYIENAVLSYVEPYASSACEMVAEILQYYSDDTRIRPVDAEALYSGIMVDTNNFLNKTGVRTFEAAAFLRRSGADVTRVRKLFRDDMEDYQARAEIVRNAEVFEEFYAIGICPKGLAGNPTVIGAQAANELLDIRRIKASFVLTEFQDQIFISARSIDEVNVQRIMENMGGGGHLSMAGAQLKGVTMEEGKTLLKQEIKRMEAENQKIS